ncbi:EAL domain-containing protein [Halomonas aquatica]|uniref:EAL domain-containing protein n=1 Tax=Halomonas aquatica TaxID=3151123 RepID=A0ABV1NGP0_9GAMM
MTHMTDDLIFSVTLLLSLSLLYGLIVHYFYASIVTKQVLTGALFGGICVLGMVSPIELANGVIIDPRSVVLSIAGLFGGPIGAVIAASIGGGYRLVLGGDGVYVGLSIVIVSTFLGLAYRHCVKKDWLKINVLQLFLFGSLVQLSLLLLATQLPETAYKQLMQSIAIPRFFIFTIAITLLGLLLKNIENLKITELSYKEISSRLSHHLHNTPLAAITWDRNFNVMQWNKTAEDIFGYTADEAIGKHAKDLILETGSKSEHDVNQVFIALWEQQGGERSSNENVTKDGRKISCEWYNTSILDEEGKLIAVASLCEDVTSRKKSEQIIWEQAHYDSLTGLANRKMADEHLEQKIKVADRSNTSVAFFFLDLDRFKDINDARGHDIGDKLLIQVAKRLRSHLREIDTIARFGGDEFVIIIGGIDSTDQVDLIANDLVKKMAEPLNLGKELAYISASVGITLYPQDASDPIALLRNADQAMYAAKNSGGDRFQYFTPSMQKSAVSRMALINDLRTALAENQFKLYYQPIVNLMSGAIHKSEALIRWQHPERGLIGPIEFIPIAEETKLIVDIGDWVFHEASRQAVRWRSSFQPNFQISINTSPVQYKSDNFNARDWLEHLHVMKLPGDAITVEITEGTLMESRASIDQVLFDFRDANIQVSIDDFGTGYSSLSSLKKLDIDYIKIDKSFVDGIAPNSNDLALCEAVIVMAHKLDLKVIAEGIETENQKRLLIAAGCDFGQGYLFSKPLPAMEFEKLLNI